MAKSNLPLALRTATPSQLRRDIRADKGLGRLDPTSTNFGNNISFNVPVLIPTGGTVAEQLLVKGYAGDLYKDGNPWDGNNWILSGGAVFNQSAGAILSLDSFRVRITMGSGGARQQFYVSPNPQFELSIPANTVEVSVFAQAHAPSRQIAAGVYNFVGMLHRGQTSSAFSNLMTYEDEFAPGATRAVGNVSIAVPDFAKRIQTMGSTVGIMYGAGVSLTFVSSAQSLSYTGPEMAAIKNAGQKIDIPAGCALVNIQGLGDNNLPVLSWDIEL